jgi:acetyl esterase/lipase
VTALLLAALLAQTPLAVWPTTPSTPDEEKTVDGMISNVSRPTFTVFPPKGENSGVAVLVFPGGGYRRLAIELEGTEICDWLVTKGITCVLLKYRVPGSGPNWDPKCKCRSIPKVPTGLQDAQRTLSLVRHRAAEWKIDPHHIGVLGFSAGGHLVAAMSTHFTRTYAPLDEADQESSRPDFAVALYPGHLWAEPKFTLEPDIVVSKQTPPTFLVHAEDDPVDDVNHSLVYFQALKRAGVPTELHVYPRGGHAFGLRHPELPIGEWPSLVERWLKTLEQSEMRRR